MSEPNYTAGDEVLIRARILNMSESYSLEGEVVYLLSILPDEENELEVYEDSIVGKAELIEPTKANTVVVVNSNVWIRQNSDDEERWVDSLGYTRTWKQILIEGTPKVVWEPEAPKEPLVRIECLMDCVSCSAIESWPDNHNKPPCVVCKYCSRGEPYQPWNDL